MDVDIIISTVACDWRLNHELDDQTQLNHFKVITPNWLHLRVCGTNSVEELFMCFKNHAVSEEACPRWTVFLSPRIISEWGQSLIVPRNDNEKLIPDKIIKANFQIKISLKVIILSE